MLIMNDPSSDTQSPSQLPKYQAPRLLPELSRSAKIHYVTTPSTLADHPDVRDTSIDDHLIGLVDIHHKLL